METKSLTESLKEYPQFLVSVFIGLAVALLSTAEGVLFTIFGALLCWATTIPLGLAISVGLYTITFIVGKYVNGFMSLVNSKSSLFLRLISDRNGRQ